MDIDCYNHVSCPSTPINIESIIRAKGNGHPPASVPPQRRLLTEVENLQEKLKRCRDIGIGTTDEITRGTSKHDQCNLVEVVGNVNGWLAFRLC